MKKPACFLRIAVAAAALCTMATMADATSIIAIKTGDDIYLGADSKVLIERDVAISQCKITKMSDTYLIFSGMPAIPAANFNAYEIADTSFAMKGTTNEKMTAFDKAVYGKLQAAFEKLRTTDEKLFSRWYTEDVVNRIALQVLVAGKEEKGTVLAMLEYRIMSPKNAPVELKTIRQEIVTKPGSDQPKILLLGMQDAINELRARKDYFSDFNPVTLINDWIMAEAAAEPTRVSAPVDILKISPKKVEWIQHKAQCPEVDEARTKATEKPKDKARVAPAKK